ncbi:MAG: tryptophan synthase subunit alpha [Bacteroidetes bacterium]|nr:tryptophan synthase subunit alpha [Bacteroidota bacterium]MBS1539546.1 tryptophan synthase subunit alpha [Bacteroidota bacterium]
MNRINKLFQQNRGKILSVFYTAGFPQRDDTVAIAQELEKAGADMIEIGIPFSDPVADGPVIQQSNKVALDNGMNVKLLLEQIREIRKTVNLPILLMGYLNPVLQYGIEKFCTDARQAGVDGLILPDLPLREYETEYKSLFEQNNLFNIFLISPTTSEERIRQIDSLTNGFIYAVSASSTTGARNGFSSEQESYFKKLKQLQLKKPFLIGFGISNKATFLTACEYGAGAIVGSSFITLLRDTSVTSTAIKQFVHDFIN